MKDLRLFTYHDDIKRRATISSGLIIFGLLLFGCAAVGPDYMPPEVSTPQEWSAPLASGVAAEAMDPQQLATWWTTLNDPALTSLIDRALTGNLDLRQAMARVREARARRGITQADRFPIIDTTELVTQVLVDNGETIVLGGVFQLQDLTSVTKTPYLGDIPYLGRLFRRTTQSKEKTETLIFITPRILSDNLLD